jgi:hypothetical protein
MVTRNADHTGRHQPAGKLAEDLAQSPGEHAEDAVECEPPHHRGAERGRQGLLQKRGVQDTTHRDPGRVRALDQESGDRGSGTANERAARQALQMGIFAGVRCAKQHKRGYAGEQCEREVAGQTDSNHRPRRARPGRHSAAGGISTASPSG